MFHAGEQIGKGIVVRALGRAEDDLVGVVERSEEHTSELQSRLHLVCRLLLEKKKANLGCAMAMCSVWKRQARSLSACATACASSIRTMSAACGFCGQSLQPVSTWATQGPRP